MAIVLSVYVLVSWGYQGWEHILSLIGVAAPPDLVQKLTYLALRHRPDALLGVDTVRAYTMGEDYLVEVDIVLAPEMPLKLAHDIGEELQFKLESLPEVGRAFVHLDYETMHRPEH